MEALFHRRTFKDNDSAIKSGSDHVILQGASHESRQRRIREQAELHPTEHDGLRDTSLQCQQHSGGAEGALCISYHHGRLVYMYFIYFFSFFLLSHIYIYWVMSNSFLQSTERSGEI